MPGYLVLPLPAVPYINRAAEKTPSKPGFTATGKVLYSTAQPGSLCQHAPAFGFRLSARSGLRLRLSARRLRRLLSTAAAPPCQHFSAVSSFGVPAGSLVIPAKAGIH